jgi:hypothetical protein
LNDSPGAGDASGQNAKLIGEARRLIQVGEEREIRLRALGSVGVYLRTPRTTVFDEIGRPPLKDIDLVSRSEDRSEIRKLFANLGYAIDEDMLWSSEGRRFAFARVTDNGDQIDVDVFVDELRMCHTLRLAPRMDLHPATVSLADLLLQKLQIVELTLSDRQDTGVLLLEHALGPEAEEAIDVNYITGLLADDWGFCHTVLSNLEKLREKLPDTNFAAHERDVIDKRAAQLTGALESVPKTRKWKLRAKIGERKKWYEHVEEERAALL